MKKLFSKRLSWLIILILTHFLLNNSAYSQTLLKKVKIDWQVKKIFDSNHQNLVKTWSFDDAVHSYQDNILVPVYQCKVEVPQNFKVNASLENPIYTHFEEITPNQFEAFNAPTPPIKITKITEAKKTYCLINITPLRRVNGQIEFLTDFNLLLKTEPETTLNKREKRSWASKSVLADGDWYKIAVTQSGIYKIDYDFLSSLGIVPNQINPKQIKIFGNGGGMLPQSNDKFILDDLVQDAIIVQGEEDGRFDKNDYILFYAKGPNTWNYNAASELFNHEINDYSDSAFYFLTISTGNGKRIETSAPLSDPTYSTNTYDELHFFEEEVPNEITDYVKTGRNWFSRTFNLNDSRDIPFRLANTGHEFDIQYRFAARSNGISFFKMTYNGQNIENVKIGPAITASTDYLSNYVTLSSGTKKFTTSTKNLNINTLFTSSGDISSKGWIDYISINARCDLNYPDQQVFIRDPNSVGQEKTEFNFTSNTNNIKVWDVTNPYSVTDFDLNQSGNSYSFIAETMTPKEFILFQDKDAYQPMKIGKIPNQDLHGLPQSDYLIVTAPKFIDYAREIGELHKSEEELSYVVVTPQQIYNEFSSGAQDITAIRNFVKMFYDRGTQDSSPKYLLLFGDASYDYKDRIKNNTNVVPTYETPIAYSPFKDYSFASDDYFGYLDDNEGNLDNALGGSSLRLDIAIGRFPVTTIAQAEAVVNKVKRYYSRNHHGDWRNIITFIADDMDNGWESTFVTESENILRNLDTSYPVYNQKRIYSDSYKQLSTPKGNTYPDATDAVDRRMDQGSLITNYIGHGGEAGLAHEGLVTLNDIKAWNNKDALTILVTATCEFTRFDDPERVSAGEWTFLNPDGGAVTLLTTTRTVENGENISLLKKLFINNFFEKINNKHKTIGEIFLESKNKKDDDGFSKNTRKFALIGDPALMPDFPEYNVVSTKLNGKSFDETNNQLKALDKVTISGEVRDWDEKILTDFNGIVYPTIFDKKIELSTLANDPHSKKLNFESQESTIYKGKATVKNGKFSYTFIVPKDISYKKGFGKISYYASNSTQQPIDNLVTDAHGYENAVVGGVSDSFVYDDKGPVVNLFINDTNFVDGGTTNENPILIAKVFDDIGINIIGSGIGHDPKAILDDNETHKIGDFYESELDNFRKGIINYPFFDLTEGHHSIVVKVWDVANNPGEGKINFVVANSAQAALKNIFNFPNPFHYSTTFNIEHNRPNEKLDIQVQIFSASGALIKTIDREIKSEGTRVTSITWDGTDDNGARISSGVYVYRLVLKTTDGQVKDESNKLVFIK